MYEMIDPLAVTGATIDRTTGVTSSPTSAAWTRSGFLSFEGLGILPNGVTYYGDELSANGGAAGGAYYKFVPTTPWAGGAPITSLDRSPLASGTVYGLQVGTSGNNGQGFYLGTGSWVALPAAAGVPLRTLQAAEQADRLLPARGHGPRRQGARRGAGQGLRQQHRP